MHYLVFLFLFLLIPMGLLLLALWQAGVLRWWRALIGRSVLVIGLFVLYAIPWENFLAASRIWYYNPSLSLGISFGYLPLEEYAFLVLQAALTVMLVFWLWRRFYPGDFQ